MEELKRRLEGKGAWDAQVEAEVRALWKYGLAPITDEKLRRTVERFLLIVPVTFFTGYASRSGTHHTPWQNGRCGTLRSIVESCVILPDMARYDPALLDENKHPVVYFVDAALAATIISDVWKKEDEGDVHHGPQHGRVAAEHWRAFAAAEGLDRTLAEDIAHACHWHFGIYAPDWTPETVLSPVAQLVHRCDYVTAQGSFALIYEGKKVID